jgi:hypothetical protein
LRSKTFATVKEPHPNTPRFDKVRNLSRVGTMKTRNRLAARRTYRSGVAFGLLAALAFTGIPALAEPQQTPPSQQKKATPDAPPPPADALPSYDPKTGVLTPPDVDPKMAKPVPDVDPAMDKPPLGKLPAPTDPSMPKVQPK